MRRKDSGPEARGTAPAGPGMLSVADGFEATPARHRTQAFSRGRTPAQGFAARDNRLPVRSQHVGMSGPGDQPATAYGLALGFGSGRQSPWGTP